ncbi:MAG: sel1 repeat family protein [Chromatiales bacterium]|nr:sel1 repeat family protein [Chromatiales bacterium]
MVRLFVAVSLCLPAAPTLSGAYEEGLEAIQQGNFAEAYYYWRPLAEKGNNQARYNLGWMYANGDGLKIDMDKAAYWWTLAAKAGMADAQFALGLGHVTGEGFPKDGKTAVYWLLEAAKQKHEDAAQVLRRLASENDPQALAAVDDLLRKNWRVLGNVHKVVGAAVNLRMGVGLRSKVSARVPQGREVVELVSRGDWLYVGVSTSGQQGWLHRTQVQ